MTVIPDLAELGSAAGAWMYHIDGYNAGIILGKLGKIAT
jgi:hypothetical protein